MASPSPIARSRRCSDIPCLLLFVAALIGWVVAAGIAMSLGSIRRLTMPSDSDGNICGEQAGFRNKPNLLFFDLTKCAHSLVVLYGCPTPQMCVAECPSNYFYGALPQLPSGTNLSIISEKQLKTELRYCLPKVDRTLPYTRLVDGYHCAAWYMPSRPVAGRCLPNYLADGIDRLHELSIGLHQHVARTEARALAAARNGTNTDTTTARPPNDTTVHNDTGPDVAQTSDGTSITSRVLQSATAAVSQVMFAADHFSSLTCLSLVLPLILSLLFVVLLRFFVGPVIWLSLVGVAAMMVALTTVCGLKYHQLAGWEGANRTIADVGFTTDLAQYRRLRVFWLVLTIVCATLAAVVLLLIVALRQRIKLAVGLLKQCSAAIGDMITVLLVPVFSFAFQTVFCMAFVFVCLYLFGSPHKWSVVGDCFDCQAYATGDACFPADFKAHCAKSCPHATCRSNQNLLLHAYNFFSVVWAVGFVSAINQIAVATAFCGWYFSTSKRLRPQLPLLAYLQALAFHAGTAAFGSLLIALCRLARWLLVIGKRQLDKRGGRPARCVFCVCICCCWCLENCLQFINRRAYIVTALDGCGLCTGARRGMAVVMRNVARVAVTNSVTALVLMLGRLAVVISSVLLTHWLLVSLLTDSVPWVLPAIFSAVVANAVATTTFAIYTMGIDTLFYCVMVDLDTNDGSAQRPYYMSSGLASALGVTNQPVSAPTLPQRQLSQETDASIESLATPPNFMDPGAVDRRTPQTPIVPHMRQI